MRPPPPTPHIETIRESDAEGPLKAIYDASEKRAGRVYNIIKIMSLRPRQISSSMRLYETLMFDESELTRAEREMIAVVVSRENECFY